MVQTFHFASATAPWHTEANLLVRHENGASWRIPLFWRGEKRWSARLFAPFAGRYSAEVNVASFEPQSFEFAIDAPKPPSPRPLAIEGDHFTAGGRPRFFLADTWWMGLSRLKEDEFALLAQDRAKKGFNAIQLVAGLYPDMDAFDPRGRSEAGFAWSEGFGAINPAFFDLADRRIETLLSLGLTPVIFGMWGYHALAMGEENARRHWRHIVARWSAYPVVWVLAGEVSMPWYLSPNRERDHEELKRLWSRIGAYVRSIDPYQRLLSAHPIHLAHRELADASLLDFEMIQASHGGKRSIKSGVESVKIARKEWGEGPIVMDEINYEGILGRVDAKLVRHSFWTSFLCGAKGFGYGANGIWQVNRKGAPYGKSPGGNHWGDTPWDEAMEFAGGEQVARAVRWISGLAWHDFAPMCDTLSIQGHEGRIDAPFCAGITDRLRLIYCANGSFLRRLRVGHLAPFARYSLTHFDPATGKLESLGTLRANRHGVVALPRLRFKDDWALLLKKV